MGVQQGPARGPGGPAQGPGAPISRPTPNLFSPPAGRGLPPAVTLRLPTNLRTGLQLFSPGAVIHGKVTGQDGNSVFLRLGEHTLKAEARVPLEVGQSIQLKVEGQNQGQIQLQLVKTPFTKMATADLTNTLTQLKMPVNEANVALAKTMVEHNIPLTKENFTFMKTVLAQPAPPTPATGQPAPMPSRVAATNFLQSSNLPVTANNVTTLANFLNTNPQIGVQMFAVNQEFRRLTKMKSGDNACIEMMSGVQGALGDFILEPERRAAGKKSSKKLMDMARQTGIETNLGATFGGGADEDELLEMMRTLRERMSKSEDKGDYHKAMALLKGLEENLEAHKLINRARTESNLGFYYLQVPMRLENGDAAEVWVRYHSDEEGNRQVDPEDTVIEFLVTTEFMGELFFTLELRGGTVHIDLGTPNEDVREFVARYLPALADRISHLGWNTGRVGATYRPFSGRRKLVDHQAFEDLERCNVQA